MSEINEEEINEVNEELMKEENTGDDIVGDITTEQETEPMEIVAEEENEIVMDEKKDITNDETNVNDDGKDLDGEKISENMDDVQQQDDTEINEMNIDYDKLEQSESQEIEKNNIKVSSVRNSQQNISSKKNSRSDLGSNSKEDSNHKLSKNNSVNNNNNNNNNGGGGMIDKAFTEPASEQNQMRIYNGPIYCIEQVRIPPELPDIMKNYAKHIIRTQPDDVIVESYEYFKRLNKLRNSSLEDDFDDNDTSKQKINSNNSIKNNTNDSGNSNFSFSIDQDDKKKNEVHLSPLELESFYERLLDFSDGNDLILISDIRNMAEDANITQNQINEAIIVGSWDNEVEWLKFWSLMVAGSCTNLKSTLQVIIDIIGDENIIPLKKITSIVEFLLESDPNSNESVVKDITSKLKGKGGEIIEKSELLDILSVL